MRKCSLGSKLLTFPKNPGNFQVALLQVAAGENRAGGMPGRAGPKPGQGRPCTGCAERCRMVGMAGLEIY